MPVPSFGTPCATFGHDAAQPLESQDVESSRTADLQSMDCKCSNRSVKRRRAGSDRIGFGDMIRSSFGARPSKLHRMALAKPSLERVQLAHKLSTWLHARSRM